MENIQTLTREKHLDHLVRVVPLLCLAYGIQSFMMMSYSQGSPATGTLVMGLGVSLAISVVLLVTYDLRHRVQFAHGQFSVKAPWHFKEKNYQASEIQEIVVVGAAEEFQTVLVRLKNKKKLTFYFVDNGHEFKAQLSASDIPLKHAA